MLQLLRTGEGRDNARRFFVARREDLLRIAVTLITSDAGVASFPEIAQFERQGWELGRPLQRLAAGETSGEAITAGVDANSAHVMHLLMEALNEVLRSAGAGGTGRAAGASRDDAAAASRDNSQGFFDENRTEFTRIRQLVTRERASSTVPRFGGSDVTLEAERDHASTHGQSPPQRDYPGGI